MAARSIAGKAWRALREKSPHEFGAAVLWHCAAAWNRLLRKCGILSERQWAREVMDRETHRLVDGLATARLRVLEISGTAWKERFAFRSYRSVFFPEFDICSGGVEGQFDLVIAEQVWEHLLWPLRATRNVHAMLEPGGYFLVTTPFLIRVHEEPADCSRWTPTGLKHLLIEGGFDEHSIVTGAWGNRSCVKANFGTWAPYNRLTQSLRNEVEFPVVVWALAQRRP